MITQEIIEDIVAKVNTGKPMIRLLSLDEMKGKPSNMIQFSQAALDLIGYDRDDPRCHICVIRTDKNTTIVGATQLTSIASALDGKYPSKKVSKRNILRNKKIRTMLRYGAGEMDPVSVDTEGINLYLEPITVSGGVLHKVTINDPNPTKPDDLVDIVMNTVAESVEEEILERPYGHQ